MEDQMPIESQEKKPETTEATNSAPADFPNFAAAVQPSYVRSMFIGPDGLRPGWGLAFYVAMFYPLQFVATRLVFSLTFPANGLWSMALEEFAVLLAAVLPALVLMRVERRSWGVYGLPGRQAFGKSFCAGVVWGFASITVLLTAMYGLRLFNFGHLALHGLRIVKFGLFWGFFFSWSDFSKTSCFVVTLSSH